MTVKPDFYERLGQPRRFSIDPAQLEREYLARSRDFHPDFHSDASSIDQHQAEQNSAELNEAYVTLMDPFRRAEYLLQLLGGPSASEMKDIPQSFLMEMLELREEIETIREQKNEAEIARLAGTLETRYSLQISSIGAMFDNAQNLPSIRRELNSAKYLRGLIRDLNNA